MFEVIRPDVAFDHAAAARAAAECRRVARVLDGVLEQREAAARHALARWSGVHAERFRDLHRQRQAAGAAHVVALHRHAAAIEATAARASAEQRARDRHNAAVRQAAEIREPERSGFGLIPGRA